MKLKTLTKILAPLCLLLFLISFIPVVRMHLFNEKAAPRDSEYEEVVYMSDIDSLVTAVVIYGITNGIVYNGTNYVLVVEDVGPATPPGSEPTPSSRETILKFANGTQSAYLIEGNFDYSDWVEFGLMAPPTDGPPRWLVEPIEMIVGSAVTKIGDSAIGLSDTLTTVVLPNNGLQCDSNTIITGNNITTFTIPCSIELEDGSWYLPSLRTVYVSQGDVSRIRGFLIARGLDVSSITFIEQ